MFLPRIAERSHVETGQGNEERREEVAHVSSEGVIDDPPGEGEDSFLQLDPITSQYSGHVICLNQSEPGTAVVFFSVPTL